MKRAAVICALIVLACGVASAQTPDGETPANEGVCDDLKWATPGLYGLCVAFCEAQDFEPDWTLENPLENRKPASRKILENYRRKMRAGDPDMPCVHVPCPCWNAQQLDLLWPPGELNDYGCELDYTDGIEFFDRDSIWSVNDYGWGSEGYSLVTVEDRRIPGSDEGGPYCAAIFHDLDGGIDGGELFVTHEEFLACEQQLNQKGAELGFDCFLPE